MEKSNDKYVYQICIGKSYDAGEFEIWVKTDEKIKCNDDIFKILIQLGNLEHFVNGLIAKSYVDGIKTGKQSLQHELTKLLGI